MEPKKVPRRQGLIVHHDDQFTSWLFSIPGLIFFPLLLVFLIVTYLIKIEYLSPNPPPRVYFWGNPN